MHDHTTTTYGMPKYDKHSPQKKATLIKNTGALQHDSRSHQTKTGFTKTKCTLSLKWLAALCALNSVGAAGPPPTTAFDFSSQVPSGSLTNQNSGPCQSATSPGWSTGGGGGSASPFAAVVASGVLPLDNK